MTQQEETLFQRAKRRKQELGTGLEAQAMAKEIIKRAEEIADIGITKAGISVAILLPGEDHAHTTTHNYLHSHVIEYCKEAGIEIDKQSIHIRNYRGRLKNFNRTIDLSISLIEPQG